MAMEGILERYKEAKAIKAANVAAAVAKPGQTSTTTAATTQAAAQPAQNQLPVSGMVGGLLGNLRQTLEQKRAEREAERLARQQGKNQPGTTTPTTTAPGTTTPTAANGNGVPGYENDSVTAKLNGLLAEDSPYMILARQQGVRAGNARGLINSSIAGQASQAAAIAASTPLASQEAQTIAARNQARLEGDINLKNSTTLQAAQDKAAMERLKVQTSSAEKTAQMQLDADKARLAEQIAAQDRQAILAAQTNLQTAQIQADSNNTSAYLGALGTAMSNPKLKSSDRAALIAEYQRVTGQQAPLNTTAQTVPLTYLPKAA